MNIIEYQADPFTEFFTFDLIRTATIILASISCGGMLRFYWSRRDRRGMPTPAMTAFFLMSLFIIATTADNIGEPWVWYQTPVAFIAFIFVLIGVKPFLVMKKHWKR